MLLEKLTSEEIEWMEIFFDSQALAECLFSNADNLSFFDEEHFMEVRLGQLPLLSWEYGIFTDIPGLTEKEKFKFRENTGNIFCIAARLFGKTFIGEKIDLLEYIIYISNEECGFSSFDFKHIQGVLEPLVVVMEKHPIIKLFIENIKRNPYYITTKNGVTIESVNMNVADGVKAGQAFWQKHFKRLVVEEASKETQQVYENRAESRHEIGCVERVLGMSNVTKHSPAGKVFNDKDKKGQTLNLPSFINPNFDEVEERKAIKKYNGKQCFDSETEILTNNGWKKYNTILKSDKVLSLDLNSKKADYFEISNIFCYYYEGKLYQYNNLYCDFMVTENHNFVVNTVKNKKWRLIKLGRLLFDKKIERKKRIESEGDNCLQCNKKLIKDKLQKYFCSRGCQMKYYKPIFYPIKNFYLKKDFKWVGKEINKKIVFNGGNTKKYKFLFDDWLSFLGWFISEGFVYGVSGDKRYNYKVLRVNISQTKKHYVEEIKLLLNKMGLRSQYCIDRFTFTSKTVGEHLLKHCYKEGLERGCYRKIVPEYIKNLSPRQIKIILNSLFKGDGSLKNNKETLYWTTSKKLADDVQELILKVGDSTSILLTHDNLYRVSWSRKFKKAEVISTKVVPVDYKGKIWCVETNPHNTLFVRRNGKCFWSGNSIGYRVFIEGEIIDDGISALDMKRISDICYPHKVDGSIDEKVTIKNLEVNKESFGRYMSLLIVERPVNIDRLVIASDIGGLGGTTEIIIMAEVKGKWRYSYNITIRNLTQKQQYNIFKYLYQKLNPNYVALDTTDGLGRGIIEDLELDNEIEKTRLISVGFNENIEVGIVTDNKGEPIKENGKLIKKYENTTAWSVQRLCYLLYEGLLFLPLDYKLDEQLSSVMAIPKGKEIGYQCVARENHLWQAFQVFAITQFLIEYTGFKKVESTFLLKHDKSGV